MRLYRSASSRRRWPLTASAGAILFCFISTIQAESVSAADDPYRRAELKELLEARNYPATESLARQVLAEIEADRSAGAIVRAEVLDVLAEALWRAGKSRDDDSLRIAREAIAIKIRIYGRGHPIVADSQRHLAIMFEIRGQTGESRALFEDIVETRRATAGPESSELARALVDLGNFIYGTGDYEEAESLYRRALTILEAVLAPDDVQLALTLNNLAGLRLRFYDFEGAQPLYARALEIRRKAQGEDHIDLTWTLNGLALLHEDLGEYTEARALHEKVLEIRREVLGPEHVRVAGSLNNLAGVHRLLGDYTTAIDLLEQAATIGRKAADGPFTAKVLSNLADVLAETAQLERAETLSREALELRREALGEEHPAYAWNLNSLAHLLLAQNRLEEALPLLQESLRLHKELLGLEHPVVARTLSDLGTLALRSGDTSQAELELEQALVIQEMTLGTEHPAVGHTLSTLAPIQAVHGEESEALRSALRAEEIGRRHLRVSAETLIEARALAYSKARSSGWDMAACLAVRGSAAGSATRIWDSVIRSRALVLDEMMARAQAVAHSVDPELAALSAELAQASRRVSSLMLASVGPGGVESHRLAQEAAMSARVTAERNLAETSAEFRRARHRRSLGFADVRAALPDDSAMVAFVAYRAPLTGCLGTEQGPRAPVAFLEPEDGYLAFVLRAGDDEPRVIPLGAASEIDRLVAAWSGEIVLAAASEPQPLDLVVASYRVAATALREAIWDPLVPALGDSQLVLVVPDGALHRVSFIALPVDETSFLVEEGPTLHYLTAERDLVRQEEEPERGVGLLAVGGPEFGSPAHASGKLGELGGTRSPCATPASGRFTELPASIVEIEEVTRIWKRMPSRTEAAIHLSLVGHEATEAAFKARAPGYRVLHLATHGYVVGDSCGPELPASRGIGGLSRTPESGKATFSPVRRALLSGLAMAGANLPHIQGSETEDGLLTAEEVASLPLQGVEWAVLSACETGLGDISSGEGVLGLQRAFRIAGARSLIMSLWPVADQAARTWMTGLYIARIDDGADTALATREASLRALLERREQMSSLHPFYWAAFVSVGDWR